MPAAHRGETPVRRIVIDDPSLVIGEHQDVAELLERPAFQRVGRAVVSAPGKELGIVSITDVDQVMRALDLASTS